MNFDLVQKLSFLEIWLVTAYISPPWEQLKEHLGPSSFHVAHIINIVY
jgi:hypothetical protein